MAPRRPTPRTRYDAQTEQAIIRATRAARAAGESWEEAFRAARRAGYRGTMAGIEIFMRRRGAARRKVAVRGRPPGRRGRDPLQRARTVLAHAIQELERLAQQLRRHGG